MQKKEEQLWVRIYLKSNHDVQILQKEFSVEIFPSSLRQVDKNNWIVDGYVPKRIYEHVKARFRVRIIGDVEEMVKKASIYVSKTNRYK